MRLFLVPALLLSALPWTLSAAVDPGLLDLVPPDTKVLIGVQVEQALQSSFGQFVMTRFQQNDAMMQFIAATGFDFRHDMREILIAGDGNISGGRGSSVVFIRGRFQPGKIMSLAALSGATSLNYSGIAILSAPGSGPANSGAFLDPDTLIFGPESVLKKAVDQHANSAHFSGALAKKAIDASGNYDMWVATTAPLASMAPANVGGVPAALFSSITEASAGVRFDSNGAAITSEAITGSAQDAQTIAGMAQLILTMAQSSKSTEAQTGAALLKGARVSADGNTVRMTLSIPEQQLEQMFAVPTTAQKVAFPPQ
jgi:hypothetical protein